MVTSGYGSRTAWHGWILMVWSNNSQDSTWSRAMPMRALYGPCTGISNVFFITYGNHTGPLLDPQGGRTVPLWTRKGIDTTIIRKNPARASYVAARGPCGPRTGCLRYLHPYGTRKLIMHALKLYEPRTGSHNSYGATRGSYGRRAVRMVINPGPGGVMWLGHKSGWGRPDCFLAYVLLKCF